VVPDKRRHRDEIKLLQRQYPLSTIESSEIARIARETAASVGTSASGGRAFLRAYADFIERQILHRWKGFNMVVLTNGVVSAAATYLSTKATLIRDFRAFCQAVHKDVDSTVKIEPKEQTEKYYEHDAEVTLFSNNYEVSGGRALVALTFYATTTAKSLRSRWLEVAFYCDKPDVEKRVRNRGLRNKTAAIQRFGPKAASDFNDGIWVGEEIPRRLWLTGNPKTSQSAVKYTQKVLTRYLREARKLVK
jgi:hypothetical protein